MVAMKIGDFTSLAKNYIHRTGYSFSVLRAISQYIGVCPGKSIVADVGAGTGKLTENLIELGFSGYAVEPNDAMREEGINLVGSNRFAWIKGSGEVTTLSDLSVDWVLMGSSFHWTDPKISLKEFHRILKPGGHFTALWNPRNVKKNELHQTIERKIHEIAPLIQRKSSGGADHTQDWESVLLSSGHFEDLIFMQAPHAVGMDKERYLGAWRSVNDIQAQAGEEKFNQIMQMIEGEISGLKVIEVPYHTRAWTVRKKGAA